MIAAIQARLAEIRARHEAGPRDIIGHSPQHDGSILLCDGDDADIGKVFAGPHQEAVYRRIALASTDALFLLALVEEQAATLAEREAEIAADRAHVGKWLLTSAHVRALLIDLMHGDVSVNTTRAELAAALLTLATEAPR